jgi:hypothetical protein
MQARERGAALVGRRIGIALFWCLALFVTGASARSVVAQLYGWPSPRGSSLDESRCATEIGALQRLLLAHASEELRLPRDPARVQRWLVAWDKRYAELRHGCGSLDDTRRRLYWLRRNVESLLQRHTRDNLPLIERIDRALLRFSARSHPDET